MTPRESSIAGLTLPASSAMIPNSSRKQSREPNENSILHKFAEPLRPHEAMRLAFAVILAVALGAAAQPPAPHADPVSLIKAIYKTYETDNPGLPDVYSKRLQALVDKDERETPEGEVGRIDWDVFIDGQDWKLTGLKIVLVAKSSARAQVRATFKNFDQPCNMLFDLVLEDDHWRIDDVTKTLKPRWTMSKILADAPDAFPDAPPKEKSE
jgi:hypothetical protein